MITAEALISEIWQAVDEACDSLVEITPLATHPQFRALSAQVYKGKLFHITVKEITDGSTHST